MASPQRTLTIRNRASGEVATVMDISDLTDGEIDKLWRGLCYKVDFEHWAAEDSADAV